MLSSEQVKHRIAEALRDSELEQQVVDDIAFHLTDWKENLDAMQRIYEQPNISDEEITQILIQFLAHVPNHVAAAKKLIGLGPIEDIFGVGVLAEDGED